MELSKDSIERAVAHINALDVAGSSIKEIERILEPLIIGYKFAAPIYNPGVLIYRGRICEKPQNIREVIYPQPRFVKQLGRVNDVYQSFFYASMGKVAPFAEIRAKAGDTVVMSRWISMEKMLLNHVGFSNETEQILNTTRSFDAVHDFLRKTKNFHDLNTFVYNYLASKFVINVTEADNYLYKISIAIANKLFVAPFDGIMYPSLALYGNIDNIVLSPEFVDTNLKLVSIEFFKVDEVQGTDYHLSILDTATELDTNGSIKWSGRFLTWQSDHNSYGYEESGDLVLKGESGNFIFPKSEGELIDKQTPLLNLYNQKKDNGFKMSKTAEGQYNYCDFSVIFSLEYDFDSKYKHLSFYVPFVQYPTELLEFLLSNIKQYTCIDEGDNAVQLIETDGTVVFDTRDTVLENKIVVFSEERLTEKLLTHGYPDFEFTFIYTPTRSSP